MSNVYCEYKISISVLLFTYRATHCSQTSSRTFKKKCARCISIPVATINAHRFRRSLKALDSNWIGVLLGLSARTSLQRFFIISSLLCSTRKEVAIGLVLRNQMSLKGTTLMRLLFHWRFQEFCSRFVWEPFSQFCA